MSRELNGTAVLVLKGGTEIVGQMEMNLTINGAPIDIGNKSFGDNQTFLDGHLSGKGITVTGTITYNDDTVYRQVRADALVGTQDDYSIVYAGSGATVDESFAGKFVPNGLGDALPRGDRVATSITFQSSGAYVHTPAS